MQQSSSRFKESYAAIEHKKREEDLVSIATHGSATHHSWKVRLLLRVQNLYVLAVRFCHDFFIAFMCCFVQTELDSKMRHTLLAEQQARALEAQLDSLLLNELEESTVRIAD